MGRKENIDGIIIGMIGYGLGALLLVRGCQKAYNHMYHAEKTNESRQYQRENELRDYK